MTFWIQLAKVDLAGVCIDQIVEIEVAAVALLAQLFAKLESVIPPLSRISWVKAPGKISLPHQPPTIWCELFGADHFGQQGPTMVPWLVVQASSVDPRQLSRFMILTSGSGVI